MGAVAPSKHEAGNAPFLRLAPEILGTIVNFLHDDLVADEGDYSAMFKQLEILRLVHPHLAYMEPILARMFSRVVLSPDPSRREYDWKAFGRHVKKVRLTSRFDRASISKGESSPDLHAGMRAEVSRHLCSGRAGAMFVNSLGHFRKLRSFTFDVKLTRECEPALQPQEFWTLALQCVADAGAQVKELSILHSCIKEPVDDQTAAEPSNLPAGTNGSDNGEYGIMTRRGTMTDPQTIHAVTTRTVKHEEMTEPIWQLLEWYGINLTRLEQLSIIDKGIICKDKDKRSSSMLAMLRQCSRTLKRLHISSSIATLWPSNCEEPDTPQLEFLTLADCSTTVDYLARWISQSPKLQRLELHNPKFTLPRRMLISDLRPVFKALREHQPPVEIDFRGIAVADPFVQIGPSWKLSLNKSVSTNANDGTDNNESAEQSPRAAEKQLRWNSAIASLKDYIAGRAPWNPPAGAGRW